MDTNEEILKYHFSKYLDDDLGLGFYPYFIGYEKTIPSKPISHHIDDEYTFHYILSGRGYITDGNKAIPLKANDAFFFMPNRDNINKTRGYYPDKDDPWEYIWFNLKGDKVENLLKISKLSITQNYYSIENYGAIRQSLNEMIHIAMNTTKREASFFLPYVMKFFAQIADERKIGTSKDSKKERHVKEILEYMEKNYTSPDISITKIAEDMFYSVAYVSRIFAEVTGTTPIEYVTSLRMLKALDMLRSGNYTISIISESVGYSSPFYFSKKFKEYFGYPPSQYKK